MVVKLRKKFSRQRGRHTHGWGSKKKHRGSGNRGGFGMAGTGKRADQKNPSIWKDPHYFGKFGFTPQGIKKVINPINIGYLEENIAKFPSKEGVIDLKEFGYNKLLGNGEIKSKIKVKVETASEKAIEKVKEAGGEVICQKSPSARSGL
ncbi:MAG TPA: uL15 family ribosomal protein [Candidatus Nanoarchaeia archaeon]|nr:uL15 family ribosomal protein [Candidatus Nanoarchaeia archaeon]